MELIQKIIKTTSGQFMIRGTKAFTKEGKEIGNKNLKSRIELAYKKNKKIGETYSL